MSCFPVFVYFKKYIILWETLMQHKLLWINLPNALQKIIFMTVMHLDVFLVCVILTQTFQIEILSHYL